MKEIVCYVCVKVLVWGALNVKITGHFGLTAKDCAYVILSGTVSVFKDDRLVEPSSERMDKRVPPPKTPDEQSHQNVALKAN